MTSCIEIEKKKGGEGRMSKSYSRRWDCEGNYRNSKRLEGIDRRKN